MPMTNNDLIGSAEAAAILGKSPRTIHRMVKAGALTPAMTAPGGNVGVFLFHRSEVERAKAEVEENRPETPAVGMSTT